MIAILAKLAWGASLLMVATEAIALPALSEPLPVNGTDHIDEVMLKRDDAPKRGRTDIVYLVSCDYTKNWGKDRCGWTGAPEACGCRQDAKMAAWYRDWQHSKNFEWPQDRTTTVFGNRHEGAQDTMRWTGSGFKIETGIYGNSDQKPFQSAGVGDIYQWFHGDGNNRDTYHCRKDNGRLLWSESSSDTTNCFLGGEEYIQINCYSQYYCASDIPAN